MGQAKIRIGRMRRARGLNRHNNKIAIKRGRPVNKVLLFCTASVLSCALANAAQAQAQSTTTQTPKAGPIAAANEVGEVVVTGSRIARRDFVSTTPIVTQTAEALQQTGQISVERSLQQLPQFAAGTGENSGGIGGAGGRATLNLRSLGDQRNLVLMDGRRLPIASVFGQVDVNIIPQSILEGVETITGGASAIYGSDAMSGVVNFKTRAHFQGLQVDAQYGNSFKWDRQTRDLSVTGGGDFADGRGNAVISLGYTDRERLGGKDRDFYRIAVLSSFLGYGDYVPSASNLPTQAAVNAVFSRYGVTGNVPRTQPFGFNDDGTLFTVTGARNYRGVTDGEYVVAGGNVRYPFTRSTDVLSPLERKSVFGKFSYDVTDNVTAYGQVLYVNTEDDNNGGTSLTQFGTTPSIPVTNPFIPADLRTLLASRPNPNEPFNFNGRYVGLPNKSFDDRWNTYQLLVGLRGKLPISDWTYDIYASNDQTERNTTIHKGALLSRFQTLLNAPDGGASICEGGYNPFGDQHARYLSAACVDYLSADINSNETLKQNIVEGSVQGALFDLPAGEARFSVVADWRENTYVSRPDHALATPGEVQSINPTVAVQGATKVKEIAGELLLPVLKDMPFAQSLNLDAAVRYSDYDLSGGNWTYKLDGDWTIVDGLMVRAGYARAIRAPNVGELFSAATGGQAGFGNPPAAGEPCDVRTLSRQQGGAALRALCIATGVPANVVDSYIFPTTATASVISGNKELTPEEADTYTVGVVYRPMFDNYLLSGLTLSVDYYNITINNVISTINGGTVINKCYNLDGSNPNYSPTNAYCQLLSRDENGLLDLVRTPYLNLGGLKTSGVDTVIDWHGDAGPGRITLNSVIGYKIAFEQKALPGSDWQDFVGTINPNYYPKWQALTTLGYEWGPAQVALRWRYLSSMDDGTSVTRPASPSPGVPSYSSFDLTGNYKVTDDIVVRAGITNLFDKEPLVVAGTPGNTNATIYDIVGRAFYMGIRAKF
jgi:outer membrane receptor protein involved in Fe transport